MLAPSEKICSISNGKMKGVTGMINLIEQILLGAPFVVFAYWYEQEEALFETTQVHRHSIYRHGVLDLFFSVSFAFLGMMYFPPLTGTTVLLACIYVFVRSLDNIEQDKLSDSATRKEGGL